MTINKLGKKTLSHLKDFFWGTRLRKVLSIILVILILFTSIKFIFLKPKDVRADSFLKFDEGSGSTVKDDAGSAQGNITGATWKTSDLCLNGTCIYFDGNDWINFGDEASYDFTSSQDFTIQFWFRHGPATEIQTIIQKYESSGSDGGYRIRMEADGDISFGVDDTNGDFADDNIVSTVATYDDNRWHHISAVKDGVTGIYLYIDGVLIASDTNIGSTGNLTNNDNFYIGDASGIDDGNEYIGFLDEVKIYTSSARSEHEVKSDIAGVTSERGTSVSFGNQEPFLSDGLIGYWKMDENTWNNNCSTDSALDSSGNNNHADSCPNGTGPSTGAAGKFGNALDLDGSDDYFKIADNNIFDFTGSFSLSAWIYLDTFGDNGYGRIISKQAGGGGASWSFYVSDNGIGYPDNGLCINGTSNRNCSNDNVISLGQWQLATVIYDSNQSIVRFYVNGIFAGSGNYTAFTAGADDILIGDRGDLDRSFNGKIDEVRIYNRALSPDEVSVLYSWAPGPVGYWKMDEGTGQYANDQSGNILTGTLGSSSGIDSSDPTWTTGKYGNSLQFDAVNDYVYLGNPANLQITNAITVEAWVKYNKIPSGVEEYAVISKNEGGGYGILTNEAGDGKLQTYFYINGAYQKAGVATSSISPGTWYYVTATFDGNNTRFYLNGVLKETVIASGTISNPAIELSIGVNPNNFAEDDNYFNGLIDDVKIYNYARTPAQIIEDMNAGHPAPGSPVGSALGHWQFDEGYGDISYNSGSNGSTLNGNLAGSGTNCPTSGSCPIWSNSGKFGKALDFDGADDYVDLGIQSTLANMNDITLSAWIYLESFGEGNLGRILDKDTQSTNGWGFFVDNAFCNTGGNQLTFIDHFSSGAGSGGRVTWCTSANTISTGQWIHVAVTYNRTSITNDPVFYINGKLVTSTETEAPGGTAKDNSSTSLFIGNRPNTDRTFDGFIDEIQLFNSILTAEQVKQLYNQSSSSVLGTLSTTSTGSSSNSSSDSYCPPGQGTTCVGPVGEWNMNEGTGQYAYDTTGNGYYGIFGADANSGSDDPSWLNGKNGYGIKTNGTSSYLNIPYYSGLDITSNLTIEFWWKPTFTFNSSVTTDHSLVVKSSTSSDSTNDWAFFLFGPRDGGKMRFGTYGERIYTNTNVWEKDKWYHVAVAYTDSNNATIYINGKPDNADGDYVSGSIDGTNDNPIEIGRGYQSTGQNFLDATVDGLRIYNYVRTPAQIAWDYNHGAPLAYWQFDECSGSSIFDAAPKADRTITGITGTISYGSSGNTATGTCNSGVSTQMWNDGTVGKRNASLGFDGIDDYVSMGNTATIEGLTEASVCAWIKYGPSEVTKDGAIVSRYSTGGLGWLLWVDDVAGISGRTNTVAFAPDPGDNGGRVEGSTNLVTSGVWDHYCGVFKGGSHVRLYKNALLDQEVTNAVPAYVEAESLNLYVGRVDNVSPRYFEGLIDEVQIFPYALTLQQLKNVYNNGAVRFSPSSGSPQ